MNLTELEKDVIVAITENEYSDVPGDPVWSWSVADNCKITHKDQVSGVVSSLVKKGLAECWGEGEDSTVELTDAGIKAYHKIKNADVDFVYIDGNHAPFLFPQLRMEKCPKCGNNAPQSNYWIDGKGNLHWTCSNCGHKWVTKEGQK